MEDMLGEKCPATAVGRSDAITDSVKDFKSKMLPEQVQSDLKFSRLLYDLSTMIASWSCFQASR
jgi:hypothetical protein